MKKIKKKLLKQIKYGDSAGQKNIACPLYMELKNLVKTETEDTFGWFKVKKGNENWYKKIKRNNKTWYKLNENQLIRGAVESIEKYRIKNPILKIEANNKNKICYKVQCNECGKITEGKITK